ncbi:flavoprotein [Pseudofrankia inefficax]|uniref:Flavoprotein n=1 Tax=Pseudofrankia inefficax (strain DSM 45817 / CECT 9037 / DDB 130130 / EuI1c) TaxID=298654 RepID=E3IVZ1_PSEI1|nr:flavoprotein [Pseudofrankia inefficax]ADP84919.1 flavoprotein [Pseudofrankia inefficax]
MTTTPTSPGSVLYAVVCAAPPALHIRTLISQAQERGWDTCLILTPTAARWLDDDLPALEKITGHPTRSTYKLPGEPDVLPPPDAILVAPATNNTINKWALGISDTLALGLITEAIGKRLPIAALPFLNKAQAAHPAFPRSVDVLNEAGVRVLLGASGYAPHGPGESRPDQFPWHHGLDALVIY